MNEWGALIAGILSGAAVIIAAIVRYAPGRKSNSTYSTYTHHGAKCGESKVCESHGVLLQKHGDAIVAITTKLPIIQADLVEVKAGITAINSQLAK